MSGELCSKMLRYAPFYALITLLVACTGNQSADDPLPTRLALPTMTPTLAIPEQSTGTLLFWETQTGTLAEVNVLEKWEFAGIADDGVQVIVNGDEDAQFNVFIRDATGSTLVEGDNPRLDLPANGIYTVLVQGVNASSLSYEISLIYTDRPDPNVVVATPLPAVVGVPTPTPDFGTLGRFISRIDYGETLDDIFTEQTPRHMYTFTGSAGDVITAQLERISGTVDPLLVLYDADGNPLAMDDNSGGGRTAMLRNIRLPLDGNYNLQVTGSGQFGDYMLRLFEGEMQIDPVRPDVPRPTPIPPFAIPTLAAGARDIRLADHVPLVESLERPSDFERHSFIAEAGDTVTLAVALMPNSQLLPEVEVIDALGEIITTQTSSASRFDGVFIEPFTLEESGVNQVIVRGEGDTTGDYMIGYGQGTSWRDSYQREIEATERIEGEIFQRGIRDVWVLRLVAGDVITAAVTPDTNSPLDPILELTTADGTLVSSDDNSGGDRSALVASAAIPASGHYFLRVRDATSTQVGGYALVWRYINRAATATPPPAYIPIMSIDDAVNENDYQFYVFQGKEGQQVRVSVNGKPGSSFDPVAAILSPDGTVLAEGDDSGGTLNPLIILTLPEDGTYSVRVNGYLSGGEFDVYVDELP